MTRSLHDTRATNPWPRRLAVLTVALTFPLILIGGTVTTLRVGMAVPDWPTTFGHNMFTFPLSEMLASTGVFWEHGHRLWGALVGLLVVGAGVVTWSTTRSTSLRWLTVAAFVAVSMQGVLGGLRVRENSPQLAFLHGAFAQATLGIFVALAVFQNPAWLALEPRASPRGRLLRRFSSATVVLVYVQIVLGAWLRHSGHLFALVAHVALAAFVVAAVSMLAKEMGEATEDGTLSESEAQPFRSVRLRLLWMVWMQVLLGFVAAVMVYVVTGPHNPVSIGEAIFATAHVGLGALLLGQCIVTAIWARRLLPQASRSREPQAAGGAT